MKRTARFKIELWSKEYCPVRELPLHFQLPTDEITEDKLANIIMQYIKEGHRCTFGISLPEDCSPAERIGMQSEIARTFNKCTEDWDVSENSALSLYNSLSPKEREV